MLELNEAGQLGVRAYTFDGDTPGDARKAVRTKGDIVVTNPDMLHQASCRITPSGRSSSRTCATSSSTRCTPTAACSARTWPTCIRRLRRVCAFYGVKPHFILCSATIANPQEHAEALLGARCTAITESGAPRGEKHLLLWNPPVINPDLGLRASARSQTTRIARLAIKPG